MLKREKYLSKIRGFYNSDLIKILVGIRRCGKSVILKQIIEEIDNVKQNGDTIGGVVEVRVKNVKESAAWFRGKLKFVV